MNMFRFQDRVGVLDERSQRFLITVAWLGGYVTAEQAQELGIRNSVPRVHVQLKDLESCSLNPFSLSRAEPIPLTHSHCPFTASRSHARTGNFLDPLLTSHVLIHDHVDPPEFKRSEWGNVDSENLQKRGAGTSLDMCYRSD